MRTLDNHLTGVTLDRPHPDSYRPDFPLRSELAIDPDLQDQLDEAREEGRDAGYEDGKQDANDDLNAARRKHEQEIAAKDKEIDALTRQLAAKSA